MSSIFPDGKTNSQEKKQAAEDFFFKKITETA